MKYLRWLWNWSLFLTIPITILFALWASGSVNRWLQFEVKVKTSEELDLWTVGTLEAQHMLRSASAETKALQVQQALEDSGLRTINLYLAESDWDRLDRNLPHTGRKYVQGALHYDGQYRKVQLRYRGDNVYHWGYWKKSWRVKTKAAALFDGMRKFNLVAPRTIEVLNNFLSLRVAEEIGLIAPKVELVNVLINGHYHGFYILTEQLDESTLRRAGRMPGDLYSGEMIGMDHFAGVPNYLWNSAGTWRKSAVNNHFDEQSLAPLEELINVLGEARTTGDQSDLSRLLNIEAFAKFAAYEALVGTLHVSNNHNWRLYYDPWKTTFEPVAWDPVGWTEKARPRLWLPFRTDVIMNDLDAVLHANGEFIAAKSKTMAQFFEGGSDQRILRVLSDSIAALDSVIDLDADMVFGGKLIGPEQTRRGLNAFRQYVETHFRGMDSAYRDGAAKLEFSSEANRVRVWFTGVRHLDDLRIEFSEPLGDRISGQLRWENPGGQRTRNLEDLLAVTYPNSLSIMAPLMADIRVRQKDGGTWLSPMGGLEIGPGSYEIELEGLPDGSQVTSVTASHGKSQVIGRRVEWHRTLVPMAEMFDRMPHERITTPLIWSGEVRLAGVKFIDQDLTLRPGTQLHMEPGASLIVRGKLLAEGTAEQPILISKAEEAPSSKPWGTLAVVGSHADGSRFLHCDFRGGSGLKRPLYEFSGMLSMHAVEGVLVEHCSFADNEIVDDMVHAVYCEVTFRNCSWENSFADALDVDISRACIEYCLFKNSGNDAIDLMTTQAVIANVMMEGSIDKGVSVGEGSQALLYQCELRNCKFGVQAKDASLAVIAESQFSNCLQGVDAYKKNWRYASGGFVELLHTDLSGQQLQLRTDSVSRIRVTNCFVAGGLDQDFDSEISFTESDGVEGQRKIERVPNFRGDGFMDLWGRTYAPGWPDWLVREYRRRTATAIPRAGDSASGGK